MILKNPTVLQPDKVWAKLAPLNIRGEDRKLNVCDELKYGYKVSSP